MDQKDKIERLQIIEDDMQKAKLETDVYKRQLEELKPLRKKIEDECEETYGCKITDLPDHKSKLETELETLVGDLEEKIKKAKEENVVE